MIVDTYHGSSIEKYSINGDFDCKSKDYKDIILSLDYKNDLKHYEIYC